jgi:hypothetical protein
MENRKLEEAGDLPTKYKEPTEITIVRVNQQVHFSLMHLRGSDNTTPTLALFKSFTQALREADHFLAILSIHKDKQHLPSLSNKMQKANTNNGKLLTYFKPYFNRQQYSRSGFFHITASVTLENLISSPTVYEWLESNRYAIKPSPSNNDKMVKIGALCFGSEFIYREDLKTAIINHPSWQFPTLDTPPAIHLTKGDFKGPNKSTKMIFVCAERSKQIEAAPILLALYDGTSKEYPNGIMLLFIPLHNGIQYEPSYRQKVIFNHKQYLGQETATSIHRLRDLDTPVKLRNDQTVTLRLLLRSLPVSSGMSHPQLFQLVESNPTGMVTLAIYQHTD